MLDLDKKRKLVQLYAALLYNANLKGFIDGHIYSGPLKSVCVPGFNCYSCPGAIASCPLGSLQNALNAAGHTAPWYVLGILALFGVILGRTICGWLCPLGLIQEILHKIPVPKIKKSRITRLLSYLKYVFLAVFAIAIPVWYGISKGIPYPGFCKYICPAGTLEGAVGLLQNEVNSTSFYQLGILFTRKWVIMLIIGLACAFCYRTFCRFICPLGAIYGFFNRFSVIGVKVNTDRCNGCGLCVRKCYMDVKHVGDHECISCGKCIGNCSQGAISLKAGSITLAGPAVRPNTKADAEPGAEPNTIPNTVPNALPNAEPEAAVRKRRTIGRIIWGAALALLVFALLWFNLIEPQKEAAAAQSTAAAGAEIINETETTQSVLSEPETAAAVSEAESAAASGETVRSESETASSGKPAANAVIGTEEGEILPDFETELVSGGNFHLADYRGKVVVLNFWGTTCTPCVEELPYFEQLKEAYPNVEVLAIHHRAGTKKAPEFIEKQGWTHLDFALDSKEKGIYPLLGVSDALPSTIVLNKNGEIIYKAQTTLTYEQLEALVKKAS